MLCMLRYKIFVDFKLALSLTSRPTRKKSFRDFSHSLNCRKFNMNPLTEHSELCSAYHISTEAYKCHPTSDFKNPTSDFRNPTSDLLKSDIRVVQIRHPTSDIRLVTQTSSTLLSNSQLKFQRAKYYFP